MWCCSPLTRYVRFEEKMITCRPGILLSWPDGWLRPTIWGNAGIGSLVCGNYVAAFAVPKPRSRQQVQWTHCHTLSRIRYMVLATYFKTKRRLMGCSVNVFTSHKFHCTYLSTVWELKVKTKFVSNVSWAQRYRAARRHATTAPKAWKKRGGGG